jgi:hypothetical protein
MKFLMETNNDGSCKLTIIDSNYNIVNVIYCNSLQEMVSYLEVIIGVPIAA